MKKSLFVLFILFSTLAFAQSDYEKYWIEKEKREHPYLNDVKARADTQKTDTVFVVDTIYAESKRGNTYVNNYYDVLPSLLRSVLDVTLSGIPMARALSVLLQVLRTRLCNFFLELLLWSVLLWVLSVLGLLQLLCILSRILILQLQR